MKGYDEVFFLQTCQIIKVIYLHLTDFTNIYALEVRQYTSPLVSGLVLLIFFCMWPLGKKGLVTWISGKLLEKHLQPRKALTRSNVSTG